MMAALHLPFPFTEALSSFGGTTVFHRLVSARPEPQNGEPARSTKIGGAAVSLERRM